MIISYRVSQKQKKTKKQKQKTPKTNKTKQKNTKKKKTKQNKTKQNKNKTLTVFQQQISQTLLTTIKYIETQFNFFNSILLTKIISWPEDQIAKFFTNIKSTT